MSLRLRLTLLYSVLMGVILLIFGTAVFLLVNILLVNQVDEMLATEATDVMEITKVDSIGELNLISLPPLDMAANAYVQVWNRKGNLITASSAIKALDQSLDPIGLTVTAPTYRENTIRKLPPL